MNNASELNNMSPIKRALLAINKLQNELKKTKGKQNEPIAIIGIGCRFPFAENPYEFWDLLEKGKNGIDLIPKERWDINEFYSEDFSEKGKMNTKWGGFLKDVDKFDPKLFGISPREANYMDPQQRILLEVVWQTFENSGIRIDNIKGSKTGVFIGIGNNDYSQFTYGNYNENSSYTGLGNASCISANRISYILDLTGPSIAIDTACSSSLVAVHLACKSLLNGESEIAIAGGINLILSPDAHISFSQAHMMSPEGKCKTFDESADGYVRSEGCGIVLLKRLSDAENDGDNILAVIKGSSVNQDGKSNGISAPNKLAQEKVINEAIKVSNINIDEIDYIETHGTGTKLGDPIEVEALSEVFRYRKNNNKIILGALKTNIGHTETAAGIAGLIKTVLSLNNGLIPKNLNFNKINPLIPIHEIPFQIATENIEWKRSERKRIAGISSFGFGGTNAHIIVEEFPTENIRSLIPERPYHLITLSANERKTLISYLNSHKDFLTKFENVNPGNYSYSVNSGKKKFDYRVGIAFQNVNELTSKINNLLKNEFENDPFINAIEPNRNNKIAFIFTGQGSQYTQMGKILYETNPFFKNQIDECVKILDELLKCSFLEILFNENSADKLNSTLYTQPALFTIEYSLAKLWMSWGIKPDIVLGHSVGEITAAAIANVLSLEDALKLISKRSSLMNSLPLNGKMAVIFSELIVVEDAIKNYHNNISIAAINGPKNIVISGKAIFVDQVVQSFNKKQIKCHVLNVSHAFHSELMQPITNEFENSISDIEYKKAEIPIISNLTGELIKKDEVLDSKYWKQHILNPVQFYKSMKTLSQLGSNTFLEIGPNPVLIGMSQVFLTGEKNIWLSSLQKGKNDWEIILNSLIKFFNIGVNIDWHNFENGYNRKTIFVPTYPFNKERFWIENARIPSIKNKNIKDISPILNERYLQGKKLNSPIISDLIYEIELDSEFLSIVKNHVIYDSKIFPAAGFIELILSNIFNEFNNSEIIINSMTILESINFKKNSKIAQTIFTPKENNKYEFKVYSLDKNELSKQNWNLNVIGELTKNTKSIQINNHEEFSKNDLKSQKNLLFDKVNIKNYYRLLREYGFEYGKSMQSIVEIWKDKSTILGLIELSSEYKSEVENYIVHPSIIDAGFQLIASSFNSTESKNLREGIYLPIGLENLKIYKTQFDKAWCNVYSSFDNNNQNILNYKLHFFNDLGERLFEIENLKLGFISNQDLPKILNNNIESWLYNIEWIEKQLNRDKPSNEKIESSVVVFYGNSELDYKILGELKQRFDDVLLVKNGKSFSVIDYEKIEINFDSHNDYKLLFNYLFTERKINVSHVINLTNLKLEIVDSLSTYNLYEKQFEAVKHFLTFVKSIVIAGVSKLPRVWLVQNNSLNLDKSENVNLFQLPFNGFCKVINSEHPELKLTVIDLENTKDEKIIPHLIDEFEYNDLFEREISFRNNKRFVSRLQYYNDSHNQITDSLKYVKDSPSRLIINSKGDLDNLKLVPIIRNNPNVDWVEIEVHSTGLNFRDVLNALDLYPGDAGLLGGECSGIVTAVGQGVSKFKVGDEVLGIASGSFSTHVSTHENLLTMKPKNISFEEAATIPIAFLTAYYALIKLGNLTKGEKVLIHAASGGVGLAAIQIAKMFEAEIYATAGNPEKREYLKSIGIINIYDSRTIEFADEIINQTNGNGVDLILNSFNGKYIEKGLSILSSKGRFLEIGKIGIWDKEKVEDLRNDIFYHTIAIDDLSQNNSKLISVMLNEIIKYFEQGIFTPIKNTVFTISESVSAFRLMRSTKHIGKIIINQNRSIANTNFVISSDASYIITGGRGALGLVFAEWLIKKGAKYLILTGRSKLDENLKLRINQIIEEKDVKILTPSFDISSFEETENFFNEHYRNETINELKLPPIKGIIHAAGILDDGVLVNQNEDKFNKVLSPKIKGAWNLHLLTKDLKLDFMVYFSSISSVLGTPGQSNYATANAFLDGLAAYRRKLELPATSINWGPWKGEGMASNLSTNLMGITQISKSLGPIIFEKILVGNHNQIIVIPINWEEFSNQFSNIETPTFLSDFLNQNKSDVIKNTMETEFIIKLKDLKANERLEKLAELIEKNLCKVMGLPQNEKLGFNKPLNELGLDSLMGIELKKNLDHALGKNLPVTMVFNYPTIEAISKFILDEILNLSERNEKGQIKDEAMVQTYPEEKIAEIRNLTEEEVEKLLLKTLNEN
ncbi:MAG: type I polyketide synthase [Melioribacteraceae bacterium]